MSSGLDVPTLATEHDCLLLDLDGTVYRGAEPVTGARETLERIELRTLFLTNNASRMASEVADHMSEFGFVVEPDDVITSAQTAARLLADELPCGSRVLVVGTDALATEVANAGLVPVQSSGDAPTAVVQGHSPRTDWHDLAEAALAIQQGALWVACNADATFPTERGLVPGNGSIVASLRAATAAEPIVVGKPQPHMLREALRRGHFRAPLIVGDRLDTDIAGATAAGLPSLVVLSGVSTAADVVAAGSHCRPTHIAEDLRGLTEPSDAVRIGPQPGWRIQIGHGAVTITSTEHNSYDGGLSIVRAAAYATWHNTFDGSTPVLLAGDEDARRGLERWCLVDSG